jgi:PilZ domain
MLDKPASCGQHLHCRGRAVAATAELLDGPPDVRIAGVSDLGFHGCCLSMSDCFSKGASVLVKIRTGTEFFQCHATVARSISGIGMGVTFREISPPFRIVLQQWLSTGLV